MSEKSFEAVEESEALVNPDEGIRPEWKKLVALFLGGQTVSLLGSMLVQFAVFWYVTLETQSGWAMALVAFFGFFPQAIMSIFGGVWADRLNRKFLIIAADATIALSTLVLAIIMALGYTELWLLLATLAVRSLGAGVQTPAVGALIPQITPQDQLMRINGINGTIQSAMALLTPALAAVLYANFPLVWIFAIDVVTAVIGIGLLLMIPLKKVPRAPEDEDKGYLADLVEGFKFTFGNRFIRWIMVLFAAVFLLIVAPSGLTPLMVVRNFGDEVWMLSALEISFSVGMLIAGGTIAVWGGFKNRVVTILVSSAAFGVLSIGLGFSTNLWVFFGFMFLVGVSVPYFSTPSMTLLQETVPPQRIGRVFSFMSIIMAVSMPLGMVIFGPLADIISIEWVLIITGLLIFVVVFFAVVLPSGRYALEQFKAQPAESPLPESEEASSFALENEGESFTSADPLGSDAAAESAQ